MMMMMMMIKLMTITPRVPTCNSAAPTEADFDLMSRALTGTRSANIF